MAAAAGWSGAVVIVHGGEEVPPPREPSWLELVAGSVVIAVWLGFVVGQWLGMWGG